jgi:hypothetical protein
VLEPLRRWLAVLALAVSGFAWAAEIEIVNPQLVAGEDGWVLSADFVFDLNQRLEEAVNRGVVLHFVAEFELTRPRWYWLDEKIASQTRTYRLSFHALTRQYRLSTGALHQSYDSLSEALRVLARLRNWVVIEKGSDAKTGEPYAAALRMRLDLQQLPRPFQIAALGNRDWNLASDWKTWTAILPAEAR